MEKQTIQALQKIIKKSDFKNVEVYNELLYNIYFVILNIRNVMLDDTKDLKEGHIKALLDTFNNIDYLNGFIYNTKSGDDMQARILSIKDEKDVGQILGYFCPTNNTRDLNKENRYSIIIEDPKKKLQLIGQICLDLTREDLKNVKKLANQQKDLLQKALSVIVSTINLKVTIEKITSIDGIGDAISELAQIVKLAKYDDADSFKEAYLNFNDARKSFIDLCENWGYLKTVKFLKAKSLKIDITYIFIYEIVFKCIVCGPSTTFKMFFPLTTEQDNQYAKIILGLERYIYSAIGPWFKKYNLLSI